MKAAVYKKSRSGKILEIVELQKPVPKEDEVLIGVRAASVNLLDWRMKSRRPGVDVAGQVEAIGRNVTLFNPGDAVFGGSRGAFAEYAWASESKLVLKPNNLTFEQAASVPIAGLTALQALRDKGRIKTGQRVLINGAGGGVGTFAVQIAKCFGAHVTGVCSAEKVEWVRSLGADRVIDYTRADFTREDQRYDLLLDTVGNRRVSECRRVLAPRGISVHVGAPKEMRAVLAGIPAMLAWMAWSHFSRKKVTTLLAKIKRDDLTFLCELMEAGRLTPAIGTQYPLNEAAAAIAHVEAGHARGKVVITVSRGS